MLLEGLMTAAVKEVATAKSIEAVQQLAQRMGTQSIEQTHFAQNIEQLNSVNRFHIQELSSPEINNREQLEQKTNTAISELNNKLENCSWENKISFSESGEKFYSVETGKDSQLLNGDLPKEGTVEVNAQNDITLKVTPDEYHRNKVLEINELKKCDGIRDIYQQSRCLELKNGLPSDDAGHLLAREFGGPCEQFNLVPMDSYTNRWGEWRNMEKSWENSLEKGNRITDVRIESYYEGSSKRPTGFDISYKENGELKYRYVDNTPRHIDLSKV